MSAILRMRNICVRIDWSQRKFIFNYKCYANNKHKKQESKNKRKHTKIEGTDKRPKRESESIYNR